MKYICVFGSSSEKIDPVYLSTAEELGAMLAQKGCGVVFGAGVDMPLLVRVTVRTTGKASSESVSMTSRSTKTSSMCLKSTDGVTMA